MNHDAFKLKVKEFCSLSGHSLKELAAVLYLHHNTLHYKLNGSRSFKDEEIKRLIEVLARWKAVKYQAEALRLVELAGSKREIISEEPWFQKLASDYKISSAQNNLPAELNLFVGRERETEQVKSLLMESGNRLVSLTGSGGVGKTRLAIHVAAQLLNSFDSIFLVDTEPVRDPNLQIYAILRTLTIPETTEQPPLEALKTSMKEKKALLILDNYEHLLSGANFLSLLLKEIYGLKILVTSREKLHVYGENEFIVNPLPLIEVGEEINLKKLLQNPSVNLFVERVGAASPEFRLSLKNGSLIVDICRKVDGLPLAIELAAARLKYLSLETLSNKLDNRFDTLVGGPRDFPDRHNTMRKVVDWSYDLLEQPEKEFFQFLGIFEKGFSEGGINTYPNCDKNLVPQLLSSLQDKSLINSRTGGSGKRIFWMLDTIREYALEKARTENKEELYKDVHSKYYLFLGQMAEPELRGSQQQHWRARVDEELENIRSAINWFLQKGQTEQCLKLLGALGWFWYPKGYLSEGIQRFEQVLSSDQVKSGEIDPKTLAKAQLSLGRLYYGRGDYDLAKITLDKCLEIFLSFRDKTGAADAYRILGILACFKYNFPETERLFNLSVALNREMDNLKGIADGLNNLAIAYNMQGKYQELENLYEESLSIRIKLNDQQGIADSYQNLGILSFHFFEFDKSIKYFEESIVINRTLGNKVGLIDNLCSLASSYRFKQNNRKALSLLKESLDLANQIGYKKGITVCFNLKASIEIAEKKYRQAKTSILKSFTLGQEIQYIPEVVDAFYIFAYVAIEDQKLERAVKLFSSGQALHEKVGYKLPPPDQAIFDDGVKSTKVLDPEDFDAFWLEGQSLTFDQAIQYALDEC